MIDRIARERESFLAEGLVFRGVPFSVCKEERCFLAFFTGCAHAFRGMSFLVVALVLRVRIWCISKGFAG